MTVFDLNNQIDTLLIVSQKNRRYFSKFDSTFGYLVITKTEKIFLTDNRYYEMAQEVAKDQGTHSISSGENTIELDLTAQINNPTQYDKNIYIRISPTTSASFTAQGQLTVKVSSDRMSNFIDQTVPSQAHSTYDLGKIGSVNVNLRDGSLTFSHTDLALNGGNTAFSLVHTYNSSHTEHRS